MSGPTGDRPRSPNTRRTEPLRATAHLDDVDRQLVRQLVLNGHADLRTLAAATNRSLSSVSVRVHRLQDMGLITGFHARLDPTVLGRTVQAIVRVQLSPTTDARTFEDHLQGMTAVLTALELTGDPDYELRLACHSIAELDTALTALRAAGARQTVTSLVLRQVPGLDGSGFVNELLHEGNAKRPKA